MSDNRTSAKKAGDRRHKQQLALSLAVALAFPAQAATDLTMLSLEQLLEVKVVSASKYEQKQSEVAAAVSIITRDEIRTFGWRTLAEALASLPGVHTTYDRQYVFLGTRGFGLPGDLTARLLVTVNGNRVNDPTYDAGPVGRELPLDIDLIERIEFIPGPGGAVYGQNAMFGVVNVVTRSGASVDGTELSAAYQHPQALREGRASWGKVLDNGVDVVVSASILRARGEDRFFSFGATGISGVAAGMDGQRDQEFFARVSRGPWSFGVMHGDRRKDDPTGSFLSDPLVPGQWISDSQTQAQLQYDDRFYGDTLSVSGRLFAGRYRFDSVLIYGTPVAFPAAGDWRGTEWRLLSTAVANHKLLLGLEAQDNFHTDQAALDLADPTNDFRVRSSGYRVGVYAQDEWRIADTLTGTIGLRVDRNNSTGTKLSPRAALIWRATPATTLKALYGRAHRAPNVYERDYDDGLSLVGNPALSGERIDTLELVADHRAGQDLVLRGALYQWTLNDLISLGIDPASDLAQYQSGERVKATGLELSADKTWDWGGRLRGSVSFQRVRLADGSRLDNSPNVLAKLNFSSPLPMSSLRLGYELQYDSKRRSIDGTELGGFGRSNLVLSASKWAKGLEVSVGLYNLFDKHYAQPAADTNWQNAFEQDGRSVRVKVSYRL